MKKREAKLGRLAQNQSHKSKTARFDFRAAANNRPKLT
jgi:hypothetical protein